MMSATGDDLLKLYSDADWGAYINSRSSISAYLIHYGDSSISWKSNKQASL